MLCVCMYETVDKTWVCRPLYVMGHALMYVLDRYGHLFFRLYLHGYFHLYAHGFVMIIPPPVENGSPFWILKIFDVVMGVSLVYMNTCSHMHHTRVSQSIEYHQCNRISNCLHSLSLVFSICRYHISINVDTYACTYEHIFIC